MNKPLLAVIIGMPGSGKSTLAKRLGEEIRCPLISRDAIKEGCLRTLGMEMAADRDLTDQVYETFFTVIEQLLRGNTSVVAEAAFQHNAWSRKLEPLREIADVRIILCSIPPPLAHARQLMRNKRDPLFAKYHPHSPSHRGKDEPFEVLRMEVPTLELDTSNEPDLNRVLAFLK